MTRIRTISSEVDLKKETYRYFKYNLAVDQKTFYFNRGVNKYYEMVNAGEMRNEEVTQKNFEFLKKTFFKKKEKYSFISLGCGDAEEEKKLLNLAHKDKINISYFGVDSSMSMISKAQQNMKKCKFEKEFIYADFSGEKFKDEFSDIINEEETSKKIYAFLGGTLGNVPQNYIANTLGNMLQKGDSLLIEVRSQKEISHSNANEYFKLYLNYIKNPIMKKFLQHPLINLKIPLTSGKLTLEMIKETPLNTLLFNFGFTLNEKVELNLNKENLTLLEGDSIQLLNIRVYEFESLKNFFEKRNFKYLGKTLLDKNVLQIAFEKQ